ncbi:MAG: DctP family TRAP transporter solute-binding subunit [Nitrospinae bacterium]|nr:DctP family TRAP transporter solute-binding subunit [Nitrospinota bacterium]
MRIDTYKFRPLAIFIFIFLLYSCSSENKVSPPSSEDAEANLENKSGFYLKFGHAMPVQSAQHVAALKFSEMVKSKTHGKVQVEVFPNQELGTDQEMVEMARAGQLDIILPPTAKLSTLIPALQLADLPYFFETREEVYSVLDGKPGKQLLNLLNPHGLIGVAFWESGFKHFSANRKIRSPEDFKGLNVRAMKSELIMDQFRLLNSNPIPIDFHKLKQALKDGVVDAQENSLASIANMNFYEHQSHVILSNHSYLGQAFCFSIITLNKLPENIRDILISSAIELTSFERQEALNRENQYLKTIESSGTQIVTLTSLEKDKFKSRLEPLIEKYRQTIGTNFLEMANQVLGMNRGVGDNEIIIGLDADLTAGSSRAGLAIKRGMELAVREINQNGGVLGKSLRIISRDHSGISARGIDNINKFSKVKNLVAVMSGLHSPVALSELETIHKEKIIYLDPWAAATPIVDNGFEPNFVFRVSVRDEHAGPFLVRQALNAGKKNIALLLENTGWGRSNHKAMSSALNMKKKEPKIVEWFNWSEQDLTPQLKRIRAAKADIILLVANAPEGKIIIKTMVKEGIILPIISHLGITGGNFGEELKEELNQIPLKFLQTYSFLNSKSHKNKEIIKQYLNLYQISNKRKIIAPVGTAHAYDLVHLLAKAIKISGGIDRSVVRNALENIKSHNGLVKNYRPPFTPVRHDALKSDDFFLAKYDREGNIVPVSLALQTLENK